MASYDLLEEPNTGPSFTLPWFMASYDLLEEPNTGPSFTLPILWIRVQPLQHIKRFS